MISAVQQQLLQRLADGALHSGTALGSALGIGRAAVWKQVKALQALGVEIHSQQRQGYALPSALTLLNPQEIEAQLDAKVATSLSGVERFWSCDSTNSELMRRLRDGSAHSGAVLLAEHQSDGRGRRGKQWLSPFGGSLYCSLLWRFPGGLMSLSGLGLVVGVALAQAVESIGLEGVKLKWPNDLHYRDQKLGGVLIELEGESEGPTDVVVGVGLNIALADVEQRIDQPWTALAHHLQSPPSRNRLAAMLLNHLIPLLQQFEQRGLNAISSEWQRLDRVRDLPVAIHQEGEVIHGIARGIDPHGALRVEQDGEIVSHFSGDVSLRLSSRPVSPRTE